MTALTNYTENKMLDHLLRGAAAPYTAPTNLYVALFTDAGTPGDTGPAVEVVGNGYVRQAVTFQPAAGGVTSNVGDATFPVATATWGTVTYVAVMDAPSAGNAIFYGAFTASKLIEANDQFKILSGDFTISLD